MKRVVFCSALLLAFLGGCAVSAPPREAAPTTPDVSRSPAGRAVRATDEAASPSCRYLLRDEALRLRLAHGPGLRWAKGNEDAGQPCPLELDELTARCAKGANCASGKAGDRTVHVHWDGPIGSGRLWTITVWVRGVGGCCTYASTAGLRRLSRLRARAPTIEWLSDLDGDGDHELVLWSSPFPSEIAGLGETVLLPLPYVLVGDDLLLRPVHARQLYASLAALYTRLAEAVGDEGRAGNLRIAQMLRSLARGDCDPMSADTLRDESSEVPPSDGAAPGP